MVVFLILGGARGHHVEWRAGGRPLYLCSGIGRVHDRAGGHRCCPPGGGHHVRVTDRGRHECVVAGGSRSRGRMHVVPGGGGLRGAAGGCVCFVDTGGRRVRDVAVGRRWRLFVGRVRRRERLPVV